MSRTKGSNRKPVWDLNKHEEPAEQRVAATAEEPAAGSDEHAITEALPVPPETPEARRRRKHHAQQHRLAEIDAAISGHQRVIIEGEAMIGAARSSIQQLQDERVRIACTNYLTEP